MFDIFQGGFGSIVLLGLAGLVLVAIAGFAAIGDNSADPMNKLKEQVDAAPTARPSKSDSTLRRKQRSGPKVLEKYAKFLEPEDANEMSAAQQRMIQAGYYGRHAVRDFQALQFILAMAASDRVVAGGFRRGCTESSISTPMRGNRDHHANAVRYYGPRKWIDGRVEARKEEIISGLPDALDMLLICVEAGQSLDQSIQRGPGNHEHLPRLGKELTTVGEQVRAGRERSEVLKDLAKRCDISDITSFTTVMIQAAAYGTSITDALRVFASEMRDKRIMRAEEKANILPTKMTLGTMMFTVPPLLIILIGPSVVAS